MNRRIASIIFLVLLIGFFLYLIVSPKKEETQSIDVESTKNEVLENIEEMQNYVDKTSEWAGEEGGDLAYFNPPHEENGEEINPKLDVLKYFITGLMENNVDIFLSSYNPETISKDLFKVDIPDKRKVAEDIIQRITRNGKLINIEYAEIKGAFNNSTNKIKVMFKYDDHYQVVVNLHVIPTNDNHNEHGDTFVITTSAWNIIKIIESKNNQ